MKVGDKVAVAIQGVEVAQAEVKEVSDGTATLIVPATRVVMATKTDLAPEVTPSSEGAQVIVDEVVRAVEQPVEAPSAAPENASAPVPANQSTTPEASSADKVITSSSVPVPNSSSLESLDPAVQAQIAQIVAEHLAAQATVED